MPTDMDQFHTGCNGIIALVKNYSVLMDATDQVNYVLYRIGMPQRVLTHVSASRIFHLRILEMEAGSRQFLNIAGMVIVHMSDNHITDLRGIYSENRECIYWATH